MRVLLIIFLTFFLVACGVFRKNKKVDKAALHKEKSEIVVEKKGIAIEQDKKDTELVELIIRMPKDRAPKLETDSLQYGYESLRDAVVAAIGRSEETIIRSTRTTEDHNRYTDSSKAESNRSEKLDSSVVRSDLVKDSNTTAAANIPWFVWLVGMGLIFLLVFLVLKRYRIVK